MFCRVQEHMELVTGKVCVTPLQSNVANSTVITLTTQVNGITLGVLRPIQLHMLKGVTGTTKTTLQIIRLVSDKSCPNLRPHLKPLMVTIGHLASEQGGRLAIVG